jgi:hypothetical protein
VHAPMHKIRAATNEVRLLNLMGKFLAPSK